MKGERSWHIETFRARMLPLYSWRQEQHLQRHQQDRWHKKQLQRFRPFCKSLWKNGDRHLANELILGASWPAQVDSGLVNFFCACPKWVLVFNGPQSLLLVLLLLIFSWTFMLHCLSGQTWAVGNTNTNPLPIICWWCWCRLSMAATAHPNQLKSAFHWYITFCYVPPPISHLFVATHLFVALSHLFTGIS